MNISHLTEADGATPLGTANLPPAVLGALPKIVQLGDIDAFWAIEENYASAAMAKLEAFTVAQVAEMVAEAAAKGGDGKKKKPLLYEVFGKTAVLPIDGPMTKKPTSASMFFGGTSTIEVRAALREIAANSKIESLFLVFSSPGGQVDGTAALGDDIREFPKPVTSFIDGICCSAAYWVASQSSAIYSDRTAWTGSIGVKMAPIYDTSRLYAAMGIDAHAMTSGDLKSIGERGVKVSDKQLEHMRGLIAGLFSEFAATVQTGRAMDDETFAKVASGRVVLAREALDLGLIDGICSYEECLSTISGGKLPASSTPAPKKAHDQARALSARPAKENSMRNLIPKPILAFLKGSDPEALESAGIDVDALEGAPETTATDPAVLASIEALTQKVADQQKVIDQQAEHNAKIYADGIAAQAEAFWAELITPDMEGKALATWSQKDGVIETYKALAGNPATLENYKTSMKNAPKNYLQAQQIPDGAPGSSATAGLRVDLMHASVERRLGKAKADEMFKGAKN